MHHLVQTTIELFQVGVTTPFIVINQHSFSHELLPAINILKTDFIPRNIQVKIV